MLRRVMLIAVVALVGAAASVPGAGAGDRGSLATAPSALPAVTAPAVVADSSTCAGSCQTRHDQCRVNTKGGPDCDTERHRCLQTCITRKAR